MSSPHLTVRIKHLRPDPNAWLLEMKAPPRARWLKGLKYQEAAVPPFSFYHSFACTTWVDDPETAAEKIAWLKKELLRKKLKDFLYHWPNGYRVPKTRAWLDQTICTLAPALWFKTYWQGRFLKKW